MYMEIKTFIENYRHAFGPKAELPYVFWYSDKAQAETSKINGCLFKGFNRVREGGILSLDVETIGCGGGKFYTGFTEMPPHVPDFVSLKEKYKQSPEAVTRFVAALDIPRAEKLFLTFARIDRVECLEDKEGILFLATPDMLAGLTTWAFFDNNDEDAVSTLFGSGCCTMITYAVLENRRKGRRTFLGLMDPSARIYFEENSISFLVPICRFEQMYETMDKCCLFDTPAWNKIKKRIEKTAF